MYITEKTINGKKYPYLVKSIRLPNGTIKKISKILNNETRDLAKLEEKYEKYFLGKEKKLNIDYALSKYKQNTVYTEKQVRSIESIKAEYKYIISKLTKKQKKDLFDRFTANFTYESNAIEGNSLTLKDVDILISENATVEGKSLREIYETRNSRKVVDLVLGKKFCLAEPDILKMHKMLMRDIDTQTGYKKLPNYLVGRKVETTPPEKVAEEMAALLGWYHSSKDIHPLEKSTLFQARFVKIHPFEDGNGRVSRMLLNLILTRNGYPPLIVRKSQKVAYFHVLEAFDRGADTPIRQFFIDKYKSTYRKFFKVYYEYV